MISDYVYFFYFLIHIPITVLMDSTFVIPIEYQISIQKYLGAYHIETNKDFLAVNTPVWLKIFVIWELLFQLPFFFIAVFDFCRSSSQNQSKFSVSLWIWFLLYGFNAGFTTLICLVYVILFSESNGLKFTEMLNLAALYTPTMLLPFYMMYDFYVRIFNQLQIKQKQN